MPVATASGQTALLRLEQIQLEIAELLNRGALFPRERAAAAQSIVTLNKEAQVIAANPHSYQPPEPWQIDDEQDRQSAVTTVVNAVFATAPVDDILTDALIELWIHSLDQTAAQQNARQYERQSRLMRSDADIARRLKPKSCPYRLPPPPDDPTAFLGQIRELIIRTRTDIAGDRKKPTEPWRRAANHALDQLDATADWMLYHTMPTNGADSPFATEQCLDMARQFNQILYAAKTR